MNHYPHHVGDFRSATRHLTVVERALYREMLDEYYDTERPLNGDFDKLARRLLADTDELRAALASVLDEFFVLADDGWHNTRCDDEIDAYQQNQEQRSRAGRASAAKRSAAKTPKKPAKAADSGVGGATNERATPVERPLNERTANQNQNQNQNQNHQYRDGGGQTVVVCDPATVPSSAGEWSVLFGNEFGVEVPSADMHARKKFWPLATAWVSAGVSVGQMRDAVQRARTDCTEGIAYLPGYVDRVLASMSAPPAESRAEAAARHRMADLAPLAAARAPSHAPAPVADGYAFFQQQAAVGRPALQHVEVIQ